MSKTEAMLIPRLIRPNARERLDISSIRDLSVSFAGYSSNNIKLCSKMKYLGVILDLKLNFFDHIAYATAKATAVICQLSRGAGATWGFSPMIMKTLYERCVEPITLYACRVWGHRSAATQVNSRKINAVQRLMLIRTTRAYRTVSHAALCAITGVMPISNKINELLLRHQDMRSEDVEQRVSFTRFLHPAMPHRIEFNHLQEDAWPAPLSVFTDGSKSSAGVGCAFVAFVAGQETAVYQFSLHRKCSVFQAEMLAIIKALEWLESNGTHGAALVTDSMSSLAALRGHDMSHPLVYRAKCILTTCAAARSTLFFYTKAHAGTHGNECADRYAKSAVERRTADSYSKEPASSVKLLHRKQAWSRWQTRWRHESVGRHTFRFVSDVRQPLPLCLVNYHTTQFFTGHGCFGDYLVRFHIRESSACYCGAPLCNAEHVLQECTSHGEHAIKRFYQQQRQHDAPLTAIVTDADLKDCLLELSRAHTRAARTHFSR